MWYSVSLFFEDVSSDGSGAASVWQERVFLVDADNEAQARERACNIAGHGEKEYRAAAGNKLSERFRGIAQVCELGEKPPDNGCEIYWRFMKQSEATSLLKRFAD